MAEIRFEKVAKRFGGAEVVKALDLSVRDGEFFTFVGPSGCGKSTVLNMIAGLEPLTAGRILFDGRDVSGAAPGARDVAMVFQSYALYPHMTVFENIAFPLRVRKERKKTIEAEVNRVARMLGLGGLLGKRPRHLSGGQRQRVALGRAIVRRPRVFLMDEPLSNLDARLRVETRAELKRLHRELGITTVYVTHDQAEAMSLSDRLAVLNDGEVQQCDAPQEVYRKPANIFVGGFIGSPPMNFLPGEIVKTGPPEVRCLGTSFSPAIDLPPGTASVVVGIRPEDVRVTAGRTGNGLEVEISVSVIEPAGSVTWVDALGGETKIRGFAVPGEDVRSGEHAFLRIPAEKAVLFDPSSGKRL